jgi:hypothetical protein
MKAQMGQKCWTSILTSTFGTDMTSEMSAVRADRIYPQGNSLLVIFLEVEWVPWLLNADRRNRSLENFLKYFLCPLLAT